ncbi:MAG: hypothetical protein K8I60_22755 [Anaerolineae bacterium]|nr:hypothetical protein [Anaerolineae bacterium]
MNPLARLSSFIQQRSSGRLLLLLTVVMIVLGILMVSPLSPSEELMALANGRNVPDAQIWRTPDDLYSLLADYGAYGIQLYLTRVSPVDLFIPIGQALFLAVALSLVLRRITAAGNRWRMLNLLPFVAMAGDYLENISIVAIMRAYPTHLDTLAGAATLFTFVKTVVSVAAVVLILAGLVMVLVKRMRSV